jgi:hypothetical protein
MLRAASLRTRDIGLSLGSDQPRHQRTNVHAFGYQLDIKIPGMARPVKPPQEQACNPPAVPPNLSCQ